MPLLKRIGFFLIGVSIGLVFLAFFFKKKNTDICYFPNCRVLKDIRSKDLRYSEEVTKLIDNDQELTASIQFLLNTGDVNFRRSNTEATPCKSYIIEGDVNDKATELKVDNCDGYAEIISISFPEE